MAQNYYYCENYELKTVAVTATFGTCNINRLYNDGCSVSETSRNITFSIPSPISTALTIRFAWTESTTITQGNNPPYTPYNGGQSGIYTLPAGQKSVTFEHMCDTLRDCNSALIKITRINYTLLSGSIPNCGAPPVGCFLAVTGSTHADVTVRGDNDGSITVGISGATGTTTWYLNGEFVMSGYSQSSYTFTGLTAGVYDVAITDQHTPEPCVVSADDIVVLDGEFRTGDFVVLYPSGLTAVENPIIIDVSTAINNPFPVQNVLDIDVVGSLSDGDYLEFDLTSPYAYSQKFYARAYPNRPNYFLASTLSNQYGTPVGSNTLTEIATSLAESLQNDALIPKIYYVNNEGTKITLTAKETGSRFNLSSSNITSTTTGMRITQVRAGTDYCDGQIIDNYSISCEIMANTDSTNQYPMTGDSSDYNRITEVVLPFSPDNVHRFDISSILKTQVSTPKPEMDLTGSTLQPTIMQPYYTKISELYPLVANTNTVKKRYKTETPVKWVINSSLDRYSANNMSAYLQVPVKFLTNSPTTKQIQRNSSEFLYFILPRDYGTDLDCRGDLYFYDGTEVTGQTFFTISTGSTNAGGVMCLNLSYDKLGLVNYEVSGSTNRKIKRAEIAIYASGGSIQYSEVKKYRFEIDEMPRKFGILFQNSLGVYDSFDFIGVVDETISVDTDTYTVPIQYGINGNMGAGQKNVANYNTKVVKKVVVNSGWLDSNHFDWLMELAKTNNIYSTQTQNQNYLKRTDITYKKSSLDDLYEIEVSFEHTIFENSINV